jgi:hypothetical protein
MFGAANARLQQQLIDALRRVIALRTKLAGDARVNERWRAVKDFQSVRLHDTYRDLLGSDRYRAASKFFLEELYGAKDFAQRDAEALRVVPKLAKMLPGRAIETLLLAVQLDEMSEKFDSDLAKIVQMPVTAESYATAYPQVASETERERQIELVVNIGWALDKLSRVPMLSTMLQVMRGPAEMWGLDHLHHFLQHGFESFSGMRGAREFIATIERREREINRRLYAGDADPFRPVP